MIIISLLISIILIKGFCCDGFMRKNDADSKKIVMKDIDEKVVYSDTEFEIDLSDTFHIDGKEINITWDLNIHDNIEIDRIGPILNFEVPEDDKIRMIRVDVRSGEDLVTSREIKLIVKLKPVIQIESSIFNEDDSYIKLNVVNTRGNPSISDLEYQIKNG
jgi:hypothetical protein